MIVHNFEYGILYELSLGVFSDFQFLTAHLARFRAGFTLRAGPGRL